MDTTATRNETRRDATNRDTIMSVADAAVAFGISEGAVRKRIERGQLAARKVAGQWRVILNATDATGHDATAYDDQTRQNTTDATAPVAPDRPRAQLDAVMQEWLAPLVRQIAEQAETIGEQRERIAHLTAERDELRAMLTASPAPPATMQATVAPSDALATPNDALAGAQRPRPRRSWLHRLLHGDFDTASGLPTQG